ncbi:MAG: RluA family pseudouridine synthase [Thermodesulfobacteriota bacterium]|nr:RluA family pseudouridine synthase [Thermodesulfobacteriota bacterium]
MKIEFEITEEFQGERVDHAVALYVKTCSRSVAASLIKSGDILVSGEKKKPGYRIKSGDMIVGTVSDEPRPVIAGEVLEIDILHEDSHIIVLNKKAGMVVHPAPGNYSGTLVNALLHHYPLLKNVGKDIVRSGIVHRLDKDTSGVMVVAKNDSAFRFLQNEFKQRRVVKKYFALVTGNMKNDSGSITLPIGRHPVKRKIMSTKSKSARHAITLWQVKKQFNGASFVEVELKTGRTHQIRVHFRSLGHPLIGDRVYGFKKRSKKRKDSGSLIENQVLRQMLHAGKLSFRHPWSGRRVDFKAPLPDDFKDILRKYSASTPSSSVLAC